MGSIYVNIGSGSSELTKEHQSYLRHVPKDSTARGAFETTHRPQDLFSARPTLKELKLTKEKEQDILGGNKPAEVVGTTSDGSHRVWSYTQGSTRPHLRRLPYNGGGYFESMSRSLRASRIMLQRMDPLMSSVTIWLDLPGCARSLHACSLHVGRRRAQRVWNVSSCMHDTEYNTYSWIT